MVNQVDYSSIDLTKLLICWRSNDSNVFSLGKPFFLANSPNSAFSFELSGYKPDPYIYEDARNVVCVFGIPILNNKIDPFLTAREYIDNLSNKSFLASINGEFLIVHFDKQNGKIRVINDRFTSIPFYYFCIDGFLLGSFAYNDLFLILNKLGRLKLREDSFYEMLWFRRLLGDKTHDEETKFLLPARVLEFDGVNVDINTYWLPNYTKSQRSLEQNSEILGDLIRLSIRRKTSDARRYGLFLSGGLDTRTILAAFPFAPTCFTAGYSNNTREFVTAAKLAYLKKSKHIYLKIPNDHYTNTYESSIKQNGGMYQCNNFFLGFKRIVREHADVCFHGHGFDYMFQGMYVPSQNYHLFSLPLVARKMKKLQRDRLALEFLNTVSYRLKAVNWAECVLSSKRQMLFDKICEQLNSLIESVGYHSDDVYDQWEYLTFHALSRHYSYPDHASINSNVEQRTLSFDNDIYDLYLSLSAKQRFDAKIQRGALKNLDARFSAVPSANDGLPIASSFVRTLYQIKRGITKYKGKKPFQDDHLVRTWPTYGWIIKNEMKFLEIAKTLGSSSALSKIGWLDLGKVQQRIDRWLNDPEGVCAGREGDFIWTLISLDGFLKQIS